MWYTDQSNAGNCCLSPNGHDGDSLCGPKGCVNPIVEVGYHSLWGLIVRDEVASCCLEPLADELGFKTVPGMRSKAERMYASYAQEWYSDKDAVTTGHCVGPTEDGKCLHDHYVTEYSITEAGYDGIWDLISRGHLYDDCEQAVADHFGYEDVGQLERAAENISRVVA